MSEEGFHSYLMEVSTAADAFTVHQCAILARRVIWRAMRIEASGWFGGDYNYKSFWDEYCHLTQYDGGTEEEGWAIDLIESIIEQIIVNLPRETLHLISLSQAFATGEDQNGTVGINSALVMDAILIAVSEIAINRELEHLGPHRNGD